MKTSNKLAIAAMICGVLVSCENKVTYEVPAPEDVMMYQVKLLQICLVITRESL